MIGFTFSRQNNNNNKKLWTAHMLFEVPGTDSWPGYQTGGVLLDFKAVMILMCNSYCFSSEWLMTRLKCVSLKVQVTLQDFSRAPCSATFIQKFFDLFHGIQVMQSSCCGEIHV